MLISTKKEDTRKITAGLDLCGYHFEGTCDNYACAIVKLADDITDKLVWTNLSRTWFLGSCFTAEETLKYIHWVEGFCEVFKKLEYETSIVFSRFRQDDSEPNDVVTYTDGKTINTFTKLLKSGNNITDVRIYKKTDNSSIYMTYTPGTETLGSSNFLSITKAGNTIGTARGETAEDVMISLSHDLKDYILNAMLAAC